MDTVTVTHNNISELYPNERRVFVSLSLSLSLSLCLFAEKCVRKLVVRARCRGRLLCRYIVLHSGESLPARWATNRRVGPS